VRQNLRVFDHVAIRVRDFEASGAFYRLALGEPRFDDGTDFTAWGDFTVARTSEERPEAKRLHIGFGAHDRGEVDSWWERMTNDYQSDGDPGERPWYHESYCGAFVLDPDSYLRTLIRLLAVVPSGPPSPSISEAHGRAGGAVRRCLQSNP
jgi:catechol 2,3-dioxygenase-like lactoylglutathione lyase family enzyme